MFKPAKATAQCLSHWRLSCLATLPAGSVTPGEQAHLDTCQACHALWQHEQALVSARRQQALPAYLQAELASNTQSHKAAASPQWSWASWWPALALGGAAAATFVLIAVWPANESASERIKGKTSNAGNSEIHLSALRGEKLIVHDVRLNQAPALVDGDRLRLRLVTTKRWFGLWTQEAGEWTSLAQGAVPQDGWLSLGFRYSSKHRSTMAVLLCPQEPVRNGKALQATTHPKGCERVPFAL